MSTVCDWVLGADERIRFAMEIDDLGNIKCIKSIYNSRVPQISPELAQKVGDILAVLVAGLFRELSLSYGNLYMVIKHEMISTVGMRTKGGYLIFMVKEEVTNEVIQRVKETLNLCQVKR
jgi:hypothetical protein